MPVSYTLPTGGDHPRIFMSNANGNKGPLLTTIRDRVTTGSNKTHRKWWDGKNSDGSTAVPPPTGATLQSYCNSRLNTTTYPNTYYSGKDAEYASALAFSYLMDNANIAHADRAIQIALYFAGLTLDTTSAGREKLRAMAMIYDWCYARLSTTDRATIRMKIRDYVDDLRGEVSSEFLWGEKHGDNCAALFGILAILEDMEAGEGTTDATLVTWLEALLSNFDDDTNVCYFAGFRHFGNTDGGTHKGTGPNGYDTTNEDFYVRLMPAMKSCLAVNWATSELWWHGMIHWKLWNWRGDRTFYRRGENKAYAMYVNVTQAHAMQAAAANNNVFGEHAQWLADEIESLNDPFGGIWGPYQIWNICFRDVTRASIRPTNARVGSAVKQFSNVVATCVREDWNEAGLSMYTNADKYFTGGHTMRDCGQFQTAVNGKPIFIKAGHYDPNQDTTYKNPSVSTLTGHRYTYSARAIAHNVVRIKSDNEPVSYMVDGFQETLSGGTRFGVRTTSNTLSATDVVNIGDQHWPKNTGATKFEPHSIDDLIGASPETKWLYTPLAQAPVETSQYVYFVYDLTKAYWSSKITLYRRHFLWVKTGVIPGWDYPVILVFDDITLPSVTTTPANKATIYQLQSKYAPTWDAGAQLLTFTNGNGRCFHKTLSPAIQRTQVSGFFIDGVEFAPTTQSDWDDSYDNATDTTTIVRQELNPVATGTRIQFVNALFHCASSISAPPTTTYYSEGTSADSGYVGGTIGGVVCKIELGGSPFAAVVGSGGSEPPPSTPGIVKVDTVLYNNQTLTAGGGTVTSAWQDVSNSHETQVHVKLTNTTGITTRATVQIEVCANSTNSIGTKFEKALLGTKINNDVKSVSVKLPISVKYFRLVSTSPAGGDCRLDCEYTKVTGI